ncbi:type II toxin-antitoxin system VapC family toxin [Sphingomonas cannabina]|uniref:type II toxin-antitoxin system VapC family toxin n=1 Tax=Sphingomonas cannabina TaxID=2899123 RepID=UPI001F3D36BB|nr:type II toxin-antitoxin system VapC family toxin [Sphingomonas cannabina]UIJ46434.1 type II toxin-antitoxin system VapC family toxin [Sphingomonas cannabina]
MSVLLDTHFVIWLAKDGAELTPRERAFLDAQEERAWISAISIWELRIKWSKVSRNGERKGALAPEAAMLFADLAGIEIVPITGVDCTMPLRTPLSHKDPFDEMLLVHAQQRGARLLTRDSDLQGHPLVVSL